MLKPFVVLAGTFILVVSAALPVSADEFFGRAECGASGGPGCEVGAESEETRPQPPTQEQGGSGDDGAEDGTVEAEPACEGDTSLMRCVASIGGAADDGDEVDLEALAHQARAEFQVPAPDISMSPSPDTDTLVHVPVWMWITTDIWQEQTATASVPGGSVTVTATPSSVSWDMGDGTTVDCDGSGTAYDPDVHDPEDTSPDCGHTYTTPGAVEVSVQMSWDITWETSDDEGGALPALVTEASTSVRVIESSGVVT